MKKFLTTLTMSLFAMFCMAQTEPDFEFEPYVFNNSNSTFETPLPCENAYIKAKAGASIYLVGIGKVKSYYYVNGNTSPLTIDKGTQNIIINTGNKSPHQTISIIKMEVLKSKRRWKSGEVGSFTGATDDEDNSVAIKYKKYGKNSVIISTGALVPGQYCLAITNMMTNSKTTKVYTFTIK